MTTPLYNDRRWVRWSIPIGLFLGALLAAVFTVQDYGLTWDEPAYFHASELHIQWLRELRENVLKGEVSNSLRDKSIQAAWRWDPYHVPHPPFSRVVSGLTQVFFSPFMDHFSAYRVAPAIFFALLVTVMYLWMTEIFDRATGIFSALALIAIPNLFGFAHFAVTDLPLAAMWFFTAYCFWKGLQNWKWSVLLGMVWGAALSTKFPALLIPIPLLLWSHLRHRNAYANNFFSMMFLSPVVMVALQPYLWHRPGVRILEFLYEGVSRGYRPETNFPILFLGKLYYTDTVPWYYPFYMIGVTTPEMILILALLGIGMIPWLKKQSSTLTLFLANAAFILCMGLLPGAVLHDGTRQLLSVLPFMAALAGGSFYLLLQFLTRKTQDSEGLKPIRNLPAKIKFVTFLLLFFSPALDLYLCHPFQLSFYNRFVGGVQGAYARGLELTYFMEAFTPEFLRSLNSNLPRNSTINASFANFMFEFYKKTGRLRSDIRITSKPPFDYHVLLNRQSVLTPAERVLYREPSEAHFSVKLAGVPLVSVMKAR